MPNILYIKNQNKVQNVHVKLQWQDISRTHFKNNKNSYLFREEKLTLYFREGLRFCSCLAEKSEYFCPSTKAN